MKRYDLAITAHDLKKSDARQLIETYRDGIARLSIVATMNTGLMIRHMTGLPVDLIENGATGGYLQLARLVAENEARMVVSLQDPLSISLDEIGIRLLLQACTVNNIPLASNLITAEFVLHRYLETKMAAVWRCPERLYAGELACIKN
jgi:methylglyoxal synthase